MSKIDEVRADMVKAMKAKDKDTKETLSMLLAALKNKAIDKREDLTPEEETQVILKEIKQTKETLDMTPADRTEIIEECNKRLAVLEQYAPKMMDEAEIKEVVASVLAEMGLDAPTAKDKGKIMKNLMPKVKGKADGKLVNETPNQRMPMSRAALAALLVYYGIYRTATCCFFRTHSDHKIMGSTRWMLPIILILLVTRSTVCSGCTCVFGFHTQFCKANLIPATFMDCNLFFFFPFL